MKENQETFLLEKNKEIKTEKNVSDTYFQNLLIHNFQ